MASIFGKRKKEVPQNPALLNAITPIGMEFRQADMQVGEYAAKGFGVVKFPALVDQGWLSNICVSPNTITAIEFKQTTDVSQLIQAISKNVGMHESTAQQGGDPATQEAAMKAAEDGRRIIRQISNEGETIGYCSITSMATAATSKELAIQTNRLRNLFDFTRCKLRTMSSLQKETLQAVSPYYVNSDKLSPILERIAPLSSVLGGFPFASSGYSDHIGYEFAKDQAGGLILLDPWKKDGDRTNSNFVFIGQSGAGKSTAIKRLIIREYALGAKIIILDPESEYMDIVRSLGGDWINAAGGGILNPLQMRPRPYDKKEEDIAQDDFTDSWMPPLALHMKTVETFFSLYLPDLNSLQKALLKEALEQAYLAHGITWETDVTGFAADRYPTMRELYDCLLTKQQEVEKSRRDNDTNHYELLTALLRDAAMGSDQFLFNGYTTIKPTKQVVCIDIHDLQDMPDNIKRAQYFNYMGWAWEQLSRDRSERVLLIAEEAWIMVDPRIPQSISFLRNMSKRARKYEGSLACVVQSVVDILDPNVKMYGQAIIDNAAIKILMGMDGQNLKDCGDLFNLNEPERDVLLAKQRGHAIAMFGARRLPIRFDIPDWELSLMGSGGGK